MTPWTGHERSSLLRGVRAGCLLELLGVAFVIGVMALLLWVQP